MTALGKNVMPLLPATAVKSSNVRSIGYDTNTHHLQVTFHSGDTYDYVGVPPATHMGLMSAKSKGTFLQDAVKTRFRHIKRQ